MAMLNNQRVDPNSNSFGGDYLTLRLVIAMEVLQQRRRQFRQFTAAKLLVKLSLEEMGMKHQENSNR